MLFGFGAFGGPGGRGGGGGGGGRGGRGAGGGAAPFFGGGGGGGGARGGGFVGRGGGFVGRGGGGGGRMGGGGAAPFFGGGGGGGGGGPRGGGFRGGRGGGGRLAPGPFGRGVGPGLSMSWGAWDSRRRRHGPHHGHGYRRGWPWWGGSYWDYPYHVGYEYIPSDVYYVGDSFTIDAQNAGRIENIGQGVSWSAAQIGAQAYMQNNPPFVGAGQASVVRIRSGLAGPVVCEWAGTPTGWQQTFCNPGAGGYGGLGASDYQATGVTWVAAVSLFAAAAVGYVIGKRRR